MRCGLLSRKRKRRRERRRRMRKRRKRKKRFKSSKRGGWRVEKKEAGKGVGWGGVGGGKVGRMSGELMRRTAPRKENSEGRERGWGTENTEKRLTIGAKET